MTPTAYLTTDFFIYLITERDLSLPTRYTQSTIHNNHREAPNGCTTTHHYLLGPFPVAIACLALILLSTSSPLAPNGRE